jgi:anti-anti-sigma regulatory factor
MRAHVEALPQSCLLTLSLGEVDNYPLAQALRRVLRSQPASVWVDCRHVTTLPAGALRLLRRCAASLWARGGYVVLCHLPAAIRTELGADATQPLAASLLDAQQYGLDCPVPSLSLAGPESAR